MKKLLTLIILFLALPAASLPILGEGGAFLNQGPDYADDLPVRIKIDPLLNGSTVEQSFTFLTHYDNFSYEPDAATDLGAGSYADGTRRSQAGHTHVYATFLGDNSLDPASPDFWNYTNAFLGASAGTLIEPGVLEFEITLPENGEWMLYVESQYDDHTSRVRPHPQYIGAWDAAIIDVVPEPSSMVLLGLGGLLLLRRRACNASHTPL